MKIGSWKEINWYLCIGIAAMVLGVGLVVTCLAGI